MDLKRDIFFFQFWGKFQHLSVGAGFVVKVCFYQVLWPEAEGKVTKLDQGQLLCSMSMSFSCVTKKNSQANALIHYSHKLTHGWETFCLVTIYTISCFFLCILNISNKNLLNNGLKTCCLLFTCPFSNLSYMTSLTFDCQLLCMTLLYHLTFLCFHNFLVRGDYCQMWAVWPN